TSAAAPVSRGEGGPRPVLPPGLPQLFVPARAGSGPRIYRPFVLAQAEVHFADAKTGVTSTEKVSRVAPVADPVDWGAAPEPAFAVEELEGEPESGARFAEPGAGVGPKSAEAWGKDFATWIYRE